jgi:hypothetical protein
MSTEQKPVIILLNDNDSVLLGVTLGTVNKPQV